MLFGVNVISCIVSLHFVNSFFFSKIGYRDLSWVSDYRQTLNQLTNNFKQHSTIRSFHLNDLTSEEIQDLDYDPQPKIVFVGNLPFDFTEESLLGLATSRNVEGCVGARIAINKKTGKSRGFGYLDFSNSRYASSSVEILRNIQLNGREVKVDLDEGTNTPTKGRRPPQTSQEFSVFIGNLDFALTETDVLQLVKTVVGDFPAKVRLSYTLEERFRGFGHVDFGSDEVADKAVSILNGMEVFDRVLRVERAEGKQATVSPVKFFTNQQNSIFLGNLPYDITVDVVIDQLDSLLDMSGLVKAVRLSVDRETGMMKGFGHVDFDTPEIAEMAVKKLTGKDFLGRQLRVDLSTPKVPSIGGGYSSGYSGGRGGGGYRRDGGDSFGRGMNGESSSRNRPRDDSNGGMGRGRDVMDRDRRSSSANVDPWGDLGQAANKDWESRFEKSNSRPTSGGRSSSRGSGRGSGRGSAR